MAGIFLGKAAGRTPGKDHRTGILSNRIFTAPEKWGNSASSRAVCPVCGGLYAEAGA